MLDETDNDPVLDEADDDPVLDETDDDSVLDEADDDPVLDEADDDPMLDEADGSYLLHEADEFVQVTEEMKVVDPPKVLGDIVESLAGAIFVDSGLCLECVWEVFGPHFERKIGNDR